MFNRKTMIGVIFLIALNVQADRDYRYDDRDHRKGGGEKCRFVTEGCYGAYFDNLWVETVSFTNNKGQPRKFNRKDVIAYIDQNTNQYLGYKLKRISILSQRNSTFVNPKVALFVNGRKAGTQVIGGGGNAFTGFNVNPVSFEVNDCPLDLMAIVNKGSVNVYSVSYYWEQNELGFFPAPISPGRNINLTVQQLVLNIERTQRIVSPEEYVQTMVPILNEARALKRQLSVCGVPCTIDQAKALLHVVFEHESELSDIEAVPIAARHIGNIKTAVDRISEYYRIPNEEVN